MKLNTIDISPEMVMTKYMNGIKLLRPDAFDMTTHDSLITLKDMLQKPYNFYIHTKSHALVELNDACWMSTGWLSKDDAINKTFELTCENPSMAHNIFAHDIKVMQTKMPRVFEEEAILKNGKHVLGVSIKLPLYNDMNSLVGIVGTSIITNIHSQMEVNAQFTDSANLLLTHEKNNYLINYFNLSKREWDVVKLLVRGKSMREIANILNLSPRTVETYLLNTKTKLGVHTKSELIELVIDAHMNCC